MTSQVYTIPIAPVSAEMRQISANLDKKLLIPDEYREAVAKINSCRCNAYLDLRHQKIEPTLWLKMQEAILNKVPFVPIRNIDITNSSITEEEVDPRLRHMIVRKATK